MKKNKKHVYKRNLPFLLGDRSCDSSSFQNKNRILYLNTLYFYKPEWNTGAEKGMYKNSRQTVPSPSPLKGFALKVRVLLRLYWFVFSAPGPTAHCLRLGLEKSTRIRERC